MVICCSFFYLSICLFIDNHCSVYESIFFPLFLDSLCSIYERLFVFSLKPFDLFPNWSVCLLKLVCANIEYLDHQMKDCSNLKTLEEEEEDIFVLWLGFLIHCLIDWLIDQFIDYLIDVIKAIYCNQLVVMEVIFVNQPKSCSFDGNNTLWITVMEDGDISLWRTHLIYSKHLPSRYDISCVNFIIFLINSLNVNFVNVCNLGPYQNTISGIGILAQSNPFLGKCAKYRFC